MSHLSNSTYNSWFEGGGGDPGPSSRISGPYERYRFPKNDNSFRYSSLSAPSDQIRLVAISSDLDDGLIKVEMRTFDIASTPVYRCLSYTWGDQRFRNGIRLNGYHFTVGDNLWLVLEAAAQANDDGLKHWQGWWWIDAICIDQEHHKEDRMRQIARMKDIFAGGKETIAWLGTGHALSEAMRFIRSSKDQLRQIYFGENAEDVLFDLTTKFTSEKSYEAVRAVRDLFDRRYWTRVWILQELAASRCVKLACDDVFPWLEWFTARMFVQVISMADFRREELTTMQAQIKRTQPAWIMADCYQHGLTYHAPLFLDKAIYLSSGSECTEPKDYIVALLGMVNSGCGRDIEALPDEKGCTVMCRAIWCMVEDIDDPEQKSRCIQIAQAGLHQPLEMSASISGGRKGCEGIEQCDSLSICRAIANEINRGQGLVRYEYPHMNVDLTLHGVMRIPR